jgi:DNA-directed RNA polymerase subunit F
MSFSHMLIYLANMSLAISLKMNTRKTKLSIYYIARLSNVWTKSSERAEEKMLKEKVDNLAKTVRDIKPRNEQEANSCCEAYYVCGKYSCT